MHKIVFLNSSFCW